MLRPRSSVHHDPPPQGGESDEVYSSSDTDFSELSDNDADETSSESASPAHIFSPSLQRKMEREVKKASAASASRLFTSPLSYALDDFERVLSLHDRISLDKRSASAPCRVGLGIHYNAKRQRVAPPSTSASTSASVSASATSSRRNSTATQSSDNESQSSTPVTPQTGSDNPNDDDSFKQQALNLRVARLRQLKLSGALYNYTQKRKKSVWEKVVSQDNQSGSGLLKMIRHGLCPKPEAANVSQASLVDFKTLSVKERLALIESGVLSVVTRVCSGLTVIPGDFASLSLNETTASSSASKGKDAKWVNLEDLVISSFNNKVDMTKQREREKEGGFTLSVKSTIIESTEQEQDDEKESESESESYVAKLVFRFKHQQQQQQKVRRSNKPLNKPGPQYKMDKSTRDKLSSTAATMNSASERGGEEGENGIYSQAFYRLFLHALAKFHNLESISSTDPKSKERVLTLRAKDGGRGGGVDFGIGESLMKAIRDVSA